MANLRGGTFEKQIKNAFFRLLKLGEGRHFKDTNFTHSIKLAEKRDMYLRDFKEFIENKGFTSGKINSFMTQEIVKEFLSYRLANVSPKTALDYTTGFNSMLKGLEQANVNIPANPSQNDFLKEMRETFRAELKELEIEKGRYIDNLEQKLQELYNNRFESGVIGELQAQTGLRVNEAREVIENFHKYYNPQTQTLNGVIGKGNHEYQPKPITTLLAKKIEKVSHLPHLNTYYKDLKQVEINKSHDFRITYAKNLFEKKLSQGIEYKQALKEVSKEINHHRESMTEYYLTRA
jgi:hypothetical protein